MLSCHLSTTHGGGYTVSFFMLDIKQTVNTSFMVFGLTRLGIEPESTTVLVANALSTLPLIGYNY